MDQILQRGRSAPTSHNCAFSSALNQTQNNPLLRKVETPLTSGMQVTSAQLVSAPQHRTCRVKYQFSCFCHIEIKYKDITVSSPLQNQRSQVRPTVRFSKKVFQSNCNVAAAGDPRAKLGSYTQAYGTINKSDLDNLLRSQPYRQ